MKNSILLILFTTFFNLSNAQISPVNWGEEYNKTGGMTAQIYVLDFQDDFYYVVSYKKDARYLMKFSLDHELIETSDLILSDVDSLNHITDIFKLNGETYIYYEQFDDKTKIWNLYASKFNDGKIEEPYQEILSKNFNDINKLKWIPNFNIEYSQDSSKILFYNFMNNEKHNDLDIMQLIVIDNEFNILWEKLQLFPYKDKKLTIEDTRINNEGEVYVNLKLDRKTFEKSLVHPNYDYYIAKINQKEYADVLMDFNNEDILPYSSIIHLDEKSNSIICAGLYSKRRIYERQNGVFSYSIDFDLSNEKSYFKEFTSEDLTGLVNDNMAIKEKGLSKFFNLSNYFTHPNGMFSLIFEEIYTKSYINSNGYERITYNSDEIIILRFNSEGILNKISKIDKEFKSKVEDITSYVAFENNGEIYLMFNDKKSKSDRQFIESSSGKFSRYTDVAKIDKEGELVYQKTLFTNKDVKGEFVPSRITQNKNMLLIRTKRIGLSSLFVSKFSFGLCEIK